MFPQARAQVRALSIRETGTASPLSMRRRRTVDSTEKISLA
jgi:hypothetical protein